MERDGFWGADDGKTAYCSWAVWVSLARLTLRGSCPHAGAAPAGRHPSRRRAADRRVVRFVARLPLGDKLHLQWRHRQFFLHTMQSKLASTLFAKSGYGSKVLYWVGIVLANSLIGIAFWTKSQQDPMLPYFVISNAIGLTACFISWLLNRFTKRPIGVVPRVLIVAPLAVVIGVEITARTVGHIPSLIEHAKLATWINFAPSFLVAAACVSLFALFYQSAQMRTTLETERREAAELRQSETAARLALLQAQIEPHFLFNTLANVQSLIERDPARASAMLDSLNRYLRASLGRTRKPVSALSEELELVDALLQIASMRLGDRLRYRISVPDALRRLALPPLLLQPLVENALLHGIEPAIDGGEILVTAKRDGDMLELSVIDTGMGLGHSKNLHGGVGLSNVRARLNSLYGEAGRLTIVNNTGAMGGVYGPDGSSLAGDATGPNGLNGPNGGALLDAPAAAASMAAGIKTFNAARGVTATLRIPIR